MIDVGTNNEKLLKNPLCKCLVEENQQILQFSDYFLVK